MRELLVVEPTVCDVLLVWPLNKDYSLFRVRERSDMLSVLSEDPDIAR